MILVKGKPVIEGYLKEIKRDYQKKNIFIRGDVEKKELEKIKGVVSVEKTAGEFIVKIESEADIDRVFKSVSKNKITKFVVEEPSLNEIFIAKVGEAYDE